MVCGKRIGILLVLIALIMVTPVQAGYFDFLFQKESPVWDECVAIYGKESCVDYCTGNEFEAVCTYPSFTYRVFSSQLWASDCDINVWDNDTYGGVYSDQYEFMFALDVNDYKNYIDNDVRYCGDFEHHLYNKVYNVNNHMLNNVKLFQLWQLDENKVPYVSKPTQRELNSIYENDFVDADNGAVDYMIPSKYSILNVMWDCDYEGEGDLEFEGYKDVQRLEDREFIRNHYDFTEGNILPTSFNVQSYQEYYNEEFEERCEWYDFYNPFSVTDCLNLFFLKDDLADVFLGTKAKQVLIPGENVYAKEFFYSKRTRVLESIGCEYPEPTYGNANLTLKVYTNLAYTREHVLLSGEEFNNDWNEDLGIDCNAESLICLHTSEIGFHIEGTGDNRSVVYDNATFEGVNQTFEEAVDDLNTRVIQPPKHIESDDERNAREKYELDLELEESSTYRDVNQESAIALTKEFAGYMVSFIVLIAYAIQILLFIGMFVIVMNGFKHFRKAMKTIFDIKQGREK